jgi:energy-coupling factor transporter ATP-binding protein EcfA2
VSDRVQRVLARLTDAGFQTRGGPIAPFGEPLALVAAVAWDTTTSQLALIADLQADQDPETWRQLLFAGSGIRHQLAGDGPAAYGTPVILAILDEQSERALRELAEDLAENYALFNRVEINLIRHRDLPDDERLDVALAPLLPSCRRMLGQEISRGEVQRFWETLRHEIHAAAVALDPIFAAHREQAAADCARRLIGDSADAPELPAPEPLMHIELENFRTFTHAEVDLAPVTVLHGPNGSGKSTIIEALELAWAGRSQRAPDDVDPDEYARHLPRNGDGGFTITTTGQPITAVARAPASELPRCVLNQESVAKLVSSSPQERYMQLLATTGLEIPDLKARTGELIEATKRDADAALAAAGLSTLARRDSDARKLLVTALGASFAARLPSVGELTSLERALADAAAGTFAPRDWKDSAADAALSRLDALTAGVLADPDTPDLAEALDDAREALRRLASERQSAAQGAQRLMDALGAPVARQPAGKAPVSAKRAPKAPPVPAALAVRWLSHSRSVSDAAAQFREDADALKEQRWSQQLAAYADALQAAADTVPQDALEPLTRTAPATQPAGTFPQRAIAGELYTNAGFTATPKNEQAILTALGELAAELTRHAAALHALAGEVAEHPARRFAEHSERVLSAVCRFELARSLRREGPVMRASETLIGELLQQRLAPVLRELVAATVRFEWYFKPLQIPDTTRRLLLGGLSTSKADLDARMTLNSAERHVLGVAWFLALHLLQPAARRRVLVLDDPTSGFDTVNQAGFIATLRAFARLTRPDQLIIATQDDTLAAVLAEELAAVDGWPESAVTVRCRRDADDTSTTSVLACPPAAHSTSEETDMLGVAGTSTLQA